MKKYLISSMCLLSMTATSLLASETEQTLGELIRKNDQHEQQVQEAGMVIDTPLRVLENLRAERLLNPQPFAVEASEVTSELRETLENKGYYIVVKQDDPFKLTSERKQQLAAQGIFVD